MNEQVKQQETAPIDAAPTQTELAILLQDLDAGVFASKIERALSEAALGVSINGGKGVVHIKFEMKRIGQSAQVVCTHSLSYESPTERGRKTESDATQTPLYVGRGGRLTLVPDAQTDMFP
jgi:hypothetical protein